MKQIKLRPFSSLQTVLEMPADKSISHRALMISSIARGKTRIFNLLKSKDTEATLNCLKKLNNSISYCQKDKCLSISGKGKFFSLCRKITLNAGESGTTIRLLSGIMAGQKFPVKIKTAPSLQSRPMKRIIIPLSLMGADIKGVEKKTGIYPPLELRPVPELKGIKYKMPQASAQVKSAVLLAALFSKTEVRIKEPFPSRDHTERMLKLFRADLKKKSGYLVCSRSKLKSPGKLFVPGDISSAAFFIVLTAILPDSKLVLKNTGINPTRTGLVKVLKRMGADIAFVNKHPGEEAYADIRVRSSALSGITVEQEEIPLMIDEVPILMTAAAYARGTTLIKGLKELRYKETDRIRSMVSNLKRAGVDIKAEYDRKGKDWQVRIKGRSDIRSARFRSFNDHRTAMSLIIFALASGKEHFIDDVKCIDKSFPDFMTIIRKLYRQEVRGANAANGDN